MKRKPIYGYWCTATPLVSDNGTRWYLVVEGCTVPLRFNSAEHCFAYVRTCFDRSIHPVTAGPKAQKIHKELS